MNKKFKLLENLVQEAARRLLKLREDHKRLAHDNKFLKSENARLQIQLRELHTLKAKNERLRHRLERLFRLLDKLEVQALTASPQIPSPLMGQGEGGGEPAAAQPTPHPTLPPHGGEGASISTPEANVDEGLDPAGEPQETLL